MAYPEPDRPALEVTPAMIEAGVTALREKMFGQPLGLVVEDVFLAMKDASQGASASASSTNRST